MSSHFESMLMSLFEVYKSNGSFILYGKSYSKQYFITALINGFAFSKEIHPAKLLYPSKFGDINKEMPIPLNNANDACSRRAGFFRLSLP